MILGVGIDIVGVERFAATLERTPRLRTRLFVPGEIGLPMLSLAGRFAVKEALAKALGAPPGLRWTDAEVIRAGHGRPQLRTRGTVAAAAERLGVDRFHVSISHDAGLATAIVLAESAPAASCGGART